jgi:CheY-like chemotaxis protein
MDSNMRMEDRLMVEEKRKEPSKYSILVVDDQELMRNLIETFLSKLGHSCITAIDGIDALEKIKGNKIDAVVTDMRMPNMDGITLTSKISMRYPELPVMIMTAFDEGTTAGLAITVGARDFIKKPFSLNEFAVRLHKMINDSEAQRRMKSEKDVDQGVRESGDELEFPERMKRDKDVNQFIQGFMNELKSSKQMEREKGIKEGMRELLDDLSPPRYARKEISGDTVALLQHYQQVQLLALRLAEHDISIYSHSFDMLAFGNWVLVMGSGNDRIRVTWEGKDNILKTERASIPDSETVIQWQEMPSEIENTMPDVESIFRSIEGFVKKNIKA